MSHLVDYPLPLTRLNPFYPGQMGVLGTWNKTGLRQTCEGAIFYVDPNFPGVTDQRDGTDPSDPLETVAKALSLCQAYRGDTVVVMANNNYQYTSAVYGRNLPIEEAVVVDTPGVHLIGVMRSGALGVPWEAPADNSVLITVEAPDVLIEGFAFSAANHDGCTGISAVWDGVTTYGDAPVIRNNYFDTGLVYGVSLNYVYNAKIWRNEFKCENRGACIYSNPLWQDPALLDIWENRFNSNGALISLQGLDDSNIYGNSFFQELAAAGGAATDLGVDLTNGADNHVFGNWFSCVLPVPAAGDWNDLNTAGAGDAWVGNMCMNGLAITNPT